MGKVNKFKLTSLIFTIIFFISFFTSIGVLAQSLPFIIKSSIISDKSADATGTIIRVSNDEVINNITFHKLNDYVVYKLEIQSNLDRDITILEITDDNENNYLEYQYNNHANEKLNKGDSFEFLVKVLYKNELNDVTKRNQVNNVKFTIKYLDKEEQKEGAIVINPTTGDNIHFSYIMLFISSTGLIICLVLDKRRKKQKISKVSIYIITGLLLTPIVVKAATYECNILFKTNVDLYDKMVVTYVVDGNEATLTNIYGTPITELETPTKLGYMFNKWVDVDGNDFDITKPITDDITIYAHWIEIQATFLDGKIFNGKVKSLSSNSNSYYGSINTDIKSFKKSTTKPDIETMTDKNILSTSDSAAPIYGWFDNGTVYYWTEDISPSFNSDSSYAFSEFQGITNIDLTSIDTSNVTNMNRMFYKCSSLTSLDLGDNFDTGNVTDMSDMFYICSSLTSLDLEDKFNTSKVTNMAGMFSSCSSLTSLDLGENFDTSNVKNMSSMFGACLSLESLNLGEKFNTSNVTNMQYMFANCTKLTSLDLGDNFDTKKVTSMASMFERCNSLVTLKLGNKYDTSNVTNMGNMFDQCYKLTSLNLNGFNTKKVTNMVSMFRDCSSLKTLDLGNNFDTSNVTSMAAMFCRCSSLTSLNLGEKFDTSNVTITTDMFAECSNLTSLDLGEKFDTSNVTHTYRMFEKCYKLENLNLGEKFNTKNVVNMQYMFSGCSSLTSLDLSAFDTIKVTDMQNMFYYCSKLETIYVSNKFVTDNVTQSSSMFRECNKLVGGAGTKFSSSYVNKVRAKIDGGSNDPGYFTLKNHRYIKYDGNGEDSGIMIDHYLTNTDNLKENTYIKDGYKFVGWNTETDGSGTSYIDGQLMSDIVESKIPLTLYAQWELDN